MRDDYDEDESGPGFAMKMEDGMLTMAKPLYLTDKEFKSMQNHLDALGKIREVIKKSGFPKCQTEIMNIIKELEKE